MLCYNMSTSLCISTCRLAVDSSLLYAHSMINRVSGKQILYPICNLGTPHTSLSSPQALELEEFQALERQIIKDAGTSMRSSVQSVPKAAINNRVNRQKLTESSAQHSSAAQGAPQASQINKQHSYPDSHTHDQQQHANATGPFLQESSCSAVQHLHAPVTAAAQMKRHVSGNPFAELDDFLEDAVDLYAQPLSASMASQEQRVQASQYVKGFPDPQAAQQVPKQTTHTVPEATDADDMWHPPASDAVAPSGPVHQKASMHELCPLY